MPPAVLSYFPCKVDTRKLVKDTLRIAHEVVGFSFHAAPHCPLARSELPLLATNSPGFFSHTRISPTRQAVTWGEIRIGLGKVLARTLRHNVEVLKGMSPHAIISDSRINASSGNASIGLSALTCFMVAFPDPCWKSLLNPLKNEVRTTFIFTVSWLKRF